MSLNDLPELWTLPLAGAVLVVVVAVLAWRWFRHGALFGEGVEAPGRVVRKQQSSRWRSAGRPRGWLIYAYRDHLGRERRRRVRVSDSVWAKHEVDDPISVTYAPSHPSLSLPSLLVRHEREVHFAKARKRYSRVPR